MALPFPIALPTLLTPNTRSQILHQPVSPKKVEEKVTLVGY